MAQDWPPTFIFAENGMKRRICSYDIVEVPQDCYVLREEGGEMYFCTPRCLFLWAGTFVTKLSAPDRHNGTAFQMTEPSGQVRQFEGLLSVAQWAAANALEGSETAWFENGRKSVI
jgi:hypothetical protein